MNINDVQIVEVPKEADMLETIFARQRELMEKYHLIEAKNGLLQTSDIPVNLHDAKGQARLKDFAWRITEELAEAMDAITSYKEIGDHAKEEIADALHFLVEMAILSGIEPLDLTGCSPMFIGRDKLEVLWAYPERHNIQSPGQAILNFIRELGMVCHLLKNKPWKQSQMITDVDEYRLRFRNAFISFIDICIAMRITPSELFNLYFRKSEVNKFRQRSNY